MQRTSTLGFSSRFRWARQASRFLPMVFCKRVFKPTSLFVVSMHVNQVHALCRRLDPGLQDNTRAQKIFENAPESRNHTGVEQEAHCKTNILNVDAFQRAVEVCFFRVAPPTLRETTYVGPDLLNIGVVLEVLLDDLALRT